MNWNRKEIFNRRRQRTGASLWPLLFCFAVIVLSFYSKIYQKHCKLGSPQIVKIYFGKQRHKNERTPHNRC